MFKEENRTLSELYSDKEKRPSSKRSSDRAHGKIISFTLNFLPVYVFYMPVMLLRATKPQQKNFVETIYAW